MGKKFHLANESDMNETYPLGAETIEAARIEALEFLGWGIYDGPANGEVDEEETDGVVDPDTGMTRESDY